MIEKTLVVISGFFLAALAWIVEKYFLLVVGAYVLSSYKLTGQRVASDLEAIANIGGLAAFIIVFYFITKSVRKNS